MCPLAHRVDVAGKDAAVENEGGRQKILQVHCIRSLPGLVSAAGPNCTRPVGARKCAGEERGLGITGFPALVAKDDGGLAALTLGYRPFDALKPVIESWLSDTSTRG